MATFKCILVLATLMTCSSEIVGRDEKDWYKHAVIYQIYPRSFKDSNGDGMGDLKGIYEKLDYIQDVGFDTLWIQSFCKSPMVDFGYDLTDFRDVDPMFGTMQDFRQLVDAIHQRGMKIIIDFIPNHTSDQHEWFLKSINREEPYTDFYIWTDPKGYDGNKPIPPNNWLSEFGKSAWIWNDKRQQFYYRIFSVSQPDLNFRNPLVRAAIEDVIRFWLDFGVDGFRVDAVIYYLEDEQLRDNPWVSPDLVNSTEFYSQKPLYQLYSDENYQLAHEWRMVVEEYKARDGKTRILAGEAFGTPEQLVKWFGNETYLNTHFPFYLELVESMTFFRNATHLDHIICDYLDLVPPYGVASWGTSNHDNPRLTGRIDPEFAEAGMMINLLLPGIASIYYGEEIGLNDIRVRPDQKQDKTYIDSDQDVVRRRDVARGPMQWDDTINAGFTTHKKAWLPVDANYWRHNVKSQLKDPHSPLNNFKRLIKLRKSPSVEQGGYATCVVSDWVHAFVRNKPGHPPIVVVTNLGSETEEICIIDNCAQSLPDIMEVHTGSSNSGYKIGDQVTLLKLEGKPCSTLRPKAGLVLTDVGKSSANHATKPANLFLMLLILLVTGGSFFR